MAFSTLIFLFGFFAVALILYFIIPSRWMLLKNIVLLLCSLVFFAWGAPEYIILMLCSILFNYFTGLQMESCFANGAVRRAKFALISAVVVNLLLLGFFKYYGFLVENLGALFGKHWTARELPAPIGLSFFTFSILSYLIDVYRGKSAAARNPLIFALYVTLFPKLTSGPIVQYADMEEQLYERRTTWTKFGAGSRQFLIGMGKKVLLANTLGVTFYAVSGLPLSDVSTVTAWIGAISYSLMLYFDFGGYSDMAIGLGKMFGFDWQKNFDYPYCANSITDFWRRWHISLGAWFRDYVYIPLGGSRAGDARTARNLLVVWLLTGIWHGANWTFLLWGVYYGVILLLEKFVFKRILEKIPAFFRHFFTLLLVVVGWVFFFSSDLGMAFGWLARMFGGGGAGFLDGAAKYYLGCCWLPMLLGIIGSMPLVATFGNRRLMRNERGWSVLSVAFFAVLLILCIACMMNDTYTTFLYFQF